jgi:hypothetical protein
MQTMLGQNSRQEPGVVTLERFGVNSAKSFLGKNVNLHLKDGSVIINVHLQEIRKDELRREAFITYKVPYGNQHESRIPLKSIAWAELLNMSLVLTRG